MAFKILPIFGRNQEEDTLNSLRDMMKEIVAANALFRDCVKLWLDNEYPKVSEMSEEIGKHERLADDQRRKIMMQLYSGAFLPGTRSDIHQLTEEIDDIVDGIFHASSKFGYMKGKKFPEEIKATFWKLTNETRDSVDKMNTIIADLLDNNSESIMDHIKEAKEIEHNCDLLVKEIEDAIYFSKMDAMSAFLILKIAGEMASISDAVETACNRVTILKLLRRA
ncbi:MAG: DUF47 family protein [Nanoarchaeota archaeon]